MNRNNDHNNVYLPFDIAQHLDDIAECVTKESEEENADNTLAKDKANSLASQIIGLGYTMFLMTSAWHYFKSGDFGSAFSVLANLFRYIFRSIRTKHDGNDGGSASP